MKRREMLRQGLSELAQVLPWALAATGSFGRLFGAGAGRSRPRDVASFPRGHRETEAPALKKEEV
ncbi:MAG: hypothetical protein ACYDIC_15665 [Desulfobaccales bacterium]